MSPPRVLKTFLLVSVVAGTLAACGQSKDSAAPSQLAAKVNKGEISIHQLNFLLQKQNIDPARMPNVRKELLDRLVEQEVVYQQAIARKIDQDPEVLQRLEASRREILVRSYFEKLAEKVEKPSSEDVAKFFSEKPELFENRKTYKFSEIVINNRPPEWSTVLRELEAVKTIAEATELLKKYKIDLPVARNVARASEALPIELLPTFDKLKMGDVVVFPQGQQVVIAEITEVKLAPVTKAQAGPVIEQFIINKRRAEAAQADLKALKSAAQIALLGEFSQPADKGAEKSMPKAPEKAEVKAQSTPVAAPKAAEDDPLANGLKGGLK